MKLNAYPTNLGSECQHEIAQGRCEVARNEVGLSPETSNREHVRDEAVHQFERPRYGHEDDEGVLLGRLGVQRLDHVDVERVDDETVVQKRELFIESIGNARR